MLYIFCQRNDTIHFNFLIVSYSNQKVRFKWDDAGVVLNPELKLLQYNLGQPLEMAESNGYMREKHGNINFLFFPNHNQIIY